MRAPTSLKIPTTTDGIYDWAQNFSTLVVANPTDYGLVAGQVSTLAAKVSAYGLARDSNLPPARSQETVEALRLARLDLLNYVRPLTQIIANQPETSVSRALKIGVRVNPHFTSRGIAGAEFLTRTRQAVADSAPQFTILPTDNLTLKFTYHVSGAGLRTGSAHKRSAARPPGAASCQFFYKLLPPVLNRDPYEGMVPMMTATRSPFDKTFKELPGRNLFIACRWVSARGEMGPWSPIQTATVPVLGAVAALVPQA